MFFYEWITNDHETRNVHGDRGPASVPRSDSGEVHNDSIAVLRRPVADKPEHTPPSEVGSKRAAGNIPEPCD